MANLSGSAKAFRSAAASSKWTSGFVCERG
jgi:hypothetical protein